MACELSPRIFNKWAMLIFHSRWLRLLFTREFPISQAMDLWDGLFALDPSLQLSKWICVAMLVRIRNDCEMFPHYRAQSLLLD